MYLGKFQRWVPWPEGRMELLLSPLDAVDDQAILGACRIVDREPLPTDAPGTATGPVIRERTDYPRRQQLIGEKCLHGWRGPGVPKDYATKAPIEFSPAAVAAFMLVPPAADFVILQVQGLTLYAEEETAAAGKGSGASSPGSAATGPGRFVMRWLKAFSRWSPSTRSA